MYYKKRFFKICLVTLVTFFSASQAHAFGLGFSFGTGSETWSNDAGYNGDRDVSNVGFLIDTAVSLKTVYNYRFTFMKEENSANGGALDLKGYSTTHDFCFSLLNTKQIKLWVGPELKAGYYDDLYLNNSSVDVSGHATGISVGPAIGVNINLPRVVSFSVTASYHLLGSYSGDYDIAFTHDSFDVDSHGFFVNASVIFRTNE